MSDRTLYVEIRRRGGDASDPGFRRMGPFDARGAATIDAGANRNLNHRDYHTMIVAGSGGEWRSELSLRLEREVEL